MLGTNLRRYRNHRALIQGILKKKDSQVEVILCDPESPAVTFAAFQEHGNSDSPSVAQFIKEVNSSTYEWLCYLKTKNNNRYYHKLIVHKIDYALTFGLDLLEFRSGQGIIYLRCYPLMDNERDGDRPIIGIKSKNANWYSFFDIQWRRHLERAKPWPCPKT